MGLFSKGIKKPTPKSPSENSSKIHFEKFKSPLYSFEKHDINSQNNTNHITKKAVKSPDDDLKKKLIFSRSESSSSPTKKYTSLPSPPKLFKLPPKNVFDTISTTSLSGTFKNRVKSPPSPPPPPPHPKDRIQLTPSSLDPSFKIDSKINNEYNKTILQTPSFDNDIKKKSYNKISTKIFSTPLSDNVLKKKSHSKFDSSSSSSSSDFNYDSLSLHDIKKSVKNRHFLQQKTSTHHEKPTSLFPYNKDLQSHGGDYGSSDTQHKEDIYTLSNKIHSPLLFSKMQSKSLLINASSSSSSSFEKINTTTSKALGISSLQHHSSSSSIDDSSVTGKHQIPLSSSLFPHLSSLSPTEVSLHNEKYNLESKNKTSPLSQDNDMSGEHSTNILNQSQKLEAKYSRDLNPLKSFKQPKMSSSSSSSNSAASALSLTLNSNQTKSLKLLNSIKTYSEINSKMNTNNSDKNDDDVLSKKNEEQLLKESSVSGIHMISPFKKNITSSTSSRSSNNNHQKKIQYVKDHILKRHASSLKPNVTQKDPFHQTIQNIVDVVTSSPTLHKRHSLNHSSSSSSSFFKTTRRRSSRVNNDNHFDTLKSKNSIFLQEKQQESQKITTPFLNKNNFKPKVISPLETKPISNTENNHSIQKKELKKKKEIFKEIKLSSPIKSQSKKAKVILLNSKISQQPVVDISHINTQHTGKLHKVLLMKASDDSYKTKKQDIHHLDSNYIVLSKPLLPISSPQPPQTTTQSPYYETSFNELQEKYLQETRHLRELFNNEIENIRNEEDIKRERDRESMQHDYERLKTTHMEKLKMIEMEANAKSEFAEETLFKNTMTINHLLDINVLARAFLARMEERETHMKKSIMSAQRNEERFIIQLKKSIPLKEAKKFSFQALLKGQALQCLFQIIQNKLNKNGSYALYLIKHYTNTFSAKGLINTRINLKKSIQLQQHNKKQDLNNHDKELSRQNILINKIVGASFIGHLLRRLLRCHYLSLINIIKTMMIHKNVLNTSLTTNKNLLRNAQACYILGHSLITIIMRHKYYCFTKLIHWSKMTQTYYKKMILHRTFPYITPERKERLQSTFMRDYYYDYTTHLTSTKHDLHSIVPWSIIPYYQHKFPMMHKYNQAPPMAVQDFIPIHSSDLVHGRNQYLLDYYNKNLPRKKKTAAEIEFLQNQFTVGFPLVCSNNQIHPPIIPTNFNIKEFLTTKTATDTTSVTLDYRNMPLGILGTGASGYTLVEKGNAPMNNSLSNTTKINYLNESYPKNKQLSSSIFNQQHNNNVTNYDNDDDICLSYDHSLVVDESLPLRKNTWNIYRNLSSMTCNIDKEFLEQAEQEDKNAHLLRFATEQCMPATEQALNALIHTNEEPT